MWTKYKLSTTSLQGNPKTTEPKREHSEARVDGSKDLALNQTQENELRCKNWCLTHKFVAYGIDAGFSLALALSECNNSSEKNGQEAITLKKVGPVL